MILMKMDFTWVGHSCFVLFVYVVFSSNSSERVSVYFLSTSFRTDDQRVLICLESNKPTVLFWAFKNEFILEADFLFNAS